MLPEPVATWDSFTGCLLCKCARRELEVTLVEVIDTKAKGRLRNMEM
jgi:hypothetical protein